MPLKASLIIVNWNGKHHLEHCLPALTQQTLQPHEIIVVDNASTDDSLDYVRAHYPDIKLIELQENTGFSGGNIAGYEASSGDYVVLLNNDTKPLPDWLKKLVKCADEHPEVGIVASLMTNWDGGRVDTAGDGCSVTGRGFKHHMNTPTDIKLRSRYVFSACAGAALYKRELLEQVGFLEDSFYMNAEDTDLAFRAQLQGWRVFFCSQAIVRHRVSASQGAYSKAAVYYSSRNHCWLYMRCMPRPLILKYGFSYILHFLISFLFFLLKGKGFTYLQGHIDAFKQRSRVLLEREQIQNSRKVAVKDIEKQLTPLNRVIRSKLKPL